MSNPSHPGTREEEQIQLAREIGVELTDAFVAYVRSRVAFDELTFGIYDALNDLHAVASGDYELEPEAEESDQESAMEEQEDLAQEPAREAGQSA